MNKKKIIIHQQIIPEYRIPIFNKILDKYKNCTIIYGQPQQNSSLKNGNVPIEKQYLKRKNIYFKKSSNIFITNLFRYIFKSKPKVIITQYSPSNLNIYLLYLLRPFLKFKIIGWFHGWDRERTFSTNKTLYDRLRHYMLKKADAIILYSEDATQLLSKYKSPSRIFVANNTLDTTKFRELRRKFEKTGRQSLKKNLSFKTKYNIIFVSRLEPKKEPEKLIKIFQLLSNRVSDISLHIVGAGPMENELKQMVQNQKMKNVLFYGSVYDDDLTGKLIYCSDLMIIPRWVGLSIVHSFCFECPLLTFEDKFHPPEIVYLKHNKTGFILGNHTDEEIVETIETYLYDEKMHAEFRNNVLDMIDTNASIDKMKKGVSDAIDFFM